MDGQGVGEDGRAGGFRGGIDRFGGWGTRGNKATRSEGRSQSAGRAGVLLSRGHVAQTHTRTQTVTHQNPRFPPPAF